MSVITVEQLKCLVVRLADASERAADELNALDGQLGDGDLGITVSRGWREIANHADDFPDDVGLAFLAMSKAFQRVSSSSFGTLTATALMTTAKTTKGQTEVPLESVSELLSNACEAMMARGKGQLGEKSILDVIDAMAKACAGKIIDIDQLSDLLQTAVDQTLQEFRNKPAKLGRARMYGDKTIGLDDPGMLAVKRWVQGCVTPVA